MAFTIAVVGGTGPQGKGLAYRFARAGHDVKIGSRNAARAEETAAEIRAKIAPDCSVTGMANADACDTAEIVLLAVPYEGHGELVSALADQLAGKVVVSCVNPLAFDKQGPYGVEVPDKSAAEEAARIVPTATLVGAFHHLSAGSLWKESATLEDEDVLVCGDDQAANDTVAQLGAAVNGRPGIVAGPLRLARQLEPLTAVLISVNKKYKVRSGVRLTGLPDTVRQA